MDKIDRCFKRKYYFFFKQTSATSEQNKEQSIFAREAGWLKESRFFPRVVLFGSRSGKTMRATAEERMSRMGTPCVTLTFQNPDFGVRLIRPETRNEKNLFFGFYQSVKILDRTLLFFSIRAIIFSRATSLLYENLVFLTQRPRFSPPDNKSIIQKKKSTSCGFSFFRATTKVQVLRSKSRVFIESKQKGSRNFFHNGIG